MTSAACLPHLMASASSAGVKVVAVTLYVVCSRVSLGAVISIQVAYRHTAQQEVQQQHWSTRHDTVQHCAAYHRTA